MVCASRITCADVVAKRARDRGGRRSLLHGSYVGDLDVGAGYVSDQWAPWRLEPRTSGFKIDRVTCCLIGPKIPGYLEVLRTVTAGWNRVLGGQVGWFDGSKRKG